MQVDARYREAELAFLNAPFGEQGWDAAVASLAAVTGSRSAQLLALGGPLQLSLNVISNLPSDPHNHLTNPALHGPANWRVGVSEAPMQLRYEPHYAAYRSGHQTSYYDDACSDLDIPNGCHMPLLLDSNGLVGLALLRSARNGTCQAETLAAFRLLGRAAQRAVRVQLALGRELADDMLTGLAARREATILLDRFGSLSALTPCAEHLFDHPHGLRLIGGRLALAHLAEDRNLAAALARLMRSDGVDGPVLHECRVGRSADCPQGRWRLFAVRLPTMPHRFGFEPQIAITLKPA